LNARIRNSTQSILSKKKKEKKEDFFEALGSGGDCS
jgi:hypothetical protein